jgi:hypothetical protein
VTGTASDRKNKNDGHGIDKGKDQIIATWMLENTLAYSKLKTGDAL